MTGWQTPPQGRAAIEAARISAAVPVLETARLRLRAPRLADWPAYRDILMSDRAAFIGGPYSEEGAYKDFCMAVASWLLRGGGLWTFETRADASVVGFGFLWAEYGDPEPEIGWILVPEAEGLGYASEAAAAMQPFALELFGDGGVVSYIAEGNDRSARVAKSLGATRDRGAETGVPAGLQVYRHHPLPPDRRT